MSDTTLIHQYGLPRCIVRDVAAVDVRATVTDAAGTGVSFDALTSYTLYRGSRTVHTSTALTAAGGVITLTGGIPASALPDTEALSDNLMEEWVCTVSGQVYTFTRPVYLVRQLLNPCITDTDLTALHSDLLDHIDPDQTTFETQRSDAWVMLNKWLIQKGNRPHLVLDDWMLRDVHRCLALYIIAKDLATSVGDGRWHELAYGDKSKGTVGYLEKAENEFNRLTFSYDFDEDGRPEDLENKAANPVTVLNNPWGWWF